MIDKPPAQGLPPEVALDRALRGDLSALEAASKALLDSPEPFDRAWLHALDLVRGLAQPTWTAAPLEAKDLLALGASDPEAREPVFLAAAHLQLAALGSFDLEAFDRWLFVQRRLLLLTPEPERWPLIARAEAWRRVMSGDASTAESLGTLAEAAIGEPWLEVESAALAALAESESGRGQGCALAREAAALAGAEGRVHQEYLTGLVLARLRRRSGAAALSTRALRALAEVAPAPWHRWLDWEMALAGLAPGAPTRVADPSRRGIARWLAAAAAGDREAFELTREELEASVESFAPALRDLRELAVALDPEAEPDQPHPFCDGLEHRSAIAVEALSGLRDDTALAAVVLRPGRRPRRTLRSGLPLMPDAGRVGRLSPTGRSDAGAFITLAALALRGEDGTDEASLFQQVTGAALDRPRDAGALSLLLHRAREVLGSAGRLERRRGQLRLLVTGPLLIPDPRCTPPLESLLVDLLDRGSPLTVRQAARGLGLPSAEAEQALDRLQQEKACLRDQRGRAPTYRAAPCGFRDPGRPRPIALWRRR